VKTPTIDLNMVKEVEKELYDRFKVLLRLQFSRVLGFVVKKKFDRGYWEIYILESIEDYWFILPTDTSILRPRTQPLEC
jgi:hypothetical protein